MKRVHHRFADARGAIFPPSPLIGINGVAPFAGSAQDIGSKRGRPLKRSVTEPRS